MASPSLFHQADQRQSRPTKLPMVLRVYRVGFRLLDVFLPALAGRLAYALWFRPIRYPTPESEQAFYASAEKTFVQIEKHRIRQYRWGKRGAVVLLVHGWSGRGSQMGGFVDALLGRGYQVISFDCPAHGESSGNKTSILEIAAVIEFMADQHGPLHGMVCHSFGGPCAALAMRNGVSAERVVVISPQANVQFLLDRFQGILQLGKRTVTRMVEHLEKEFGSGIWEIISMEDNVTGLAMPALVLHDRDDRDIDVEQGERVAEVWPGARFCATQGLGHRRILKDRQVIETVAAFIDGDDKVACPEV